MAKVEKKVAAGSLGALAAGLALAIINAVQEDAGVLSALPAGLEFVIVAALPVLATFLGGYAAPHSPRPADPEVTR